MIRIVARLARRVRGRGDGGGRERLGHAGERIAARWLRRRGFRVLGRNVRIDHDEADLVVEDPDGRTVVIVEVKTRSSALHAPEVRVDARKQYRLARLASKLHGRRAFADRPFRFDVVAIVWLPDGAPDVRHVPGAFEAPW